jgi:hypothetical protein
VLSEKTNHHLKPHRQLETGKIAMANSMERVLESPEQYNYGSMVNDFSITFRHLDVL